MRSRAIRVAFIATLAAVTGCTSSPPPAVIGPCEHREACWPNDAGCTAKLADCDRNCFCRFGYLSCVENCGEARNCPAALPRLDDECLIDAGVLCLVPIPTKYDVDVARCTCWPTDAGTWRWTCLVVSK